MDPRIPMMVAMRERNVSITDIGARFGVTRQRIHQILLIWAPELAPRRAPGRPRLMEEVECGRCGRPFVARASDNRRRCSRKCNSIASPYRASHTTTPAPAEPPVSAS